MNPTSKCPLTIVLVSCYVTFGFVLCHFWLCYAVVLCLLCVPLHGVVLRCGGAYPCHGTCRGTLSDAPPPPPLPPLRVMVAPPAQVTQVTQVPITLTQHDTVAAPCDTTHPMWRHRGTARPEPPPPPPPLPPPPWLGKLRCVRNAGVSTTQHNTTQHNTTQHNTTQHNTTRHNTTQHNTTHHNTPQHTTTQLQHNTTQHTTTHLNTRRHSPIVPHNASVPRLNTLEKHVIYNIEVFDSRQN